MCFAKWKKPDPKDYILYNSVYKTFRKRQNYGERKQLSCCQGLGVESGPGSEGTWGNVWGKRTVLYLYYGGS